MAVKIEDLDDLHEAIRVDDNFRKLRAPARPGSRLIQGMGQDTDAKFMVVLPAPGATESVAGSALQSASGRVLRQFLAAAGMRVDRNANTWATYALKYRPAGKSPSTEEIAYSSGYLYNEWILVGKPDIVVTCGMPALNAFAGEYAQERRCYGQPFDIPYRARVWPMIDVTAGIRLEPIRKVIQAHWEELGRWLQQNR